MIKLRLFVLLTITWFVVHTLSITFDGLFTSPEVSAYGVILGNKVNTDGTLSLRLQARVDKGLELYQKGIVAQLVVSGGLGKEGYYEAQVMQQYLIEKGVPQSKIIIDDYGNTTRSSAINFIQLLPDAASVVVITQYHHVSRSKLAFKQAGLLQVSGASPFYFEWRDGYSLIREFFAYYKYLLVG